MPNYLKKINVNDSDYEFKAALTAGIPYGKVDSTSTSTSYTATVDGITELRDGVCMLLKNGVVTSASGFKININGLGAKPVYSNMAASTAETTLFNVNYTFLFVYDSTRVSSGCWILYRGYYSDTTTARGYQDYYFRPYAGSATYRYKFLMEGANHRLYPIVTTNQTSTTQVTKSPQTVGLRPWKIWYYSGTATVNAGSAFAAQSIHPAMYTTNAVYNFNASTGTYVWIYLVGSYNRDTDLFTLDSSTTGYYKFVAQNTTPSTSSFTTGKYYLLLGATYSTTNYISLFDVNPFYYFDGTNLIPVTTKVAKDLAPTKTSDLTNDSGFITSSALPTKTSDLTNDSGFITDAGVTSFNGSTGAVTYTAPVTSVNGSTGAVTVSVPSKTSDLTNDSGFITDAGVTSFNGSTGAVTYTAPVTSVNGSTGAVTISVPTVTDTYSSTSTSAMSGKAVNEALQTLDSSISAESGKAISAVTVTDGKITASSKIAVGESNQNAFSGVKIDNTTISASSTTDTFELYAGENISLTADTANKKVTIDTNGATVPSGGSSGQVLAKASGTNYDLTWVNQSGGTTYSAGDGIDITNDVISVENPVPDATVTNTFLKGVAGGDPVWSTGTYVVERDGTSSRQGMSIMSIGTNVDCYTSGGMVGAFRLFAARGSNVASVTVTPYPPSTTDGAFIRAYALGGDTPSSLAFVASSNSNTNTSGNIAIFNGGTSIVEGIAESSIEQNTNKVTSLSSSSTDVQYPSAKLLYDQLASKISEPSSEGTSGQVLTTDGNGGRTWTTVSGGAGGVAVFTGTDTIDDIYTSFTAGIPTYIWYNSHMTLVQNVTLGSYYSISAIGSDYYGVNMIRLWGFVDKEVPSGTTVSSLSRYSKTVS